MKGSVCVAVMLTIWSMIPAPAIGQDDVMTLASEAYGVHQRPAVVFAHAAHMEMIDCSRCHHDYDAYGVNQGSDGAPCADCHTPDPGGNAVLLTQAFHVQCRGCHLDIRQSQPVSPPVSCAGCHKRD